MTFPIPQATNTSQVSTADTNHTVKLPDGSNNVGHLIKVHFTYGVTGQTDPLGWPSGWTQYYFREQTAGGNEGCAGAWHQVTGSEGYPATGATITVTTAVSTKSSHLSYRTTGHANPATQPPEAATAIGTNAPADPPNLAPTGGAKDYLWIALGANSETTLHTGGDSNYSNLITIGTTGGSATINTVAGGMQRQFNAASQDPAAFTGPSATSEWVGVTVAIHPGGGAYTLIAAQASFSETGIAASLLRAAKIIAAQASFALTGQPAGLSHGYQLTAVPVTFTETGYAVNLPRSYVVSATVANFTLAGQLVNLLQGHHLAAASTTFALTGIDIGFGHGYGFSVSVGSLVLTGQGISLLQGHLLVSSVAPFTLTDNAAGLLAARRLGIASGTLILTGTDAILTYVSGYTLLANLGSYALQGLATDLRRDALLTVDMLALALTGQAVDFSRSVSYNVARPGMINYGDFKAVRRRKDRRRR